MTSLLTVWKTTPTSKPLQLGINTLHGQSHHVIVTTVETCTANVAYPLLDTISTSLVKRLVFFYVILYLVLRQLLECDVSLQMVTPVTTVWVLPESLCSISRASCSLWGLPINSPPSTTTVSAVMTSSSSAITCR